MGEMREGDQLYVMDGNEIFSGDTCIKISLIKCYTLETYIMLYSNFTSIKKVHKYSQMSPNSGK